MGLFRSSPEDALAKEVSKAVAQAMRGGAKAQGGGGGVETKWRGASRVLRSMSSWIPTLGSPSSDLSTPERKTLVARSRDAQRNHLIGRAAVVRNRTSVVGTGLMCRPQVDFAALDITEDEGEALNDALEREWVLYAEDPRECDAEATLNHYQLQALALISALSGGDSFALTPTVDRVGTVYSTRLQLIETDRVCNPNGRMDTPTMVEGIEFDEFGAPINFHVCSGYPTDRTSGKQLTWSPVRVFGESTGRRRAMQIWCDKDRPGQKRGAPLLAPVLEPLQKLERYSSAELMAAIVSAMFTVFLEKGEHFDPGSLELEAFGEEDPVSGGADGGRDVALGEGAVVDLAQGEKAVSVNPARPNAQFDPFFTSIVKEIGAAIEMPMEELMLFYSSSYSAARAAMLQAWRAYEMRRYWLVCDFCQPSYELLVDEAVALGRVSLPGYSDPARRRAFTRSVWTGPARGAIDELKEAKAARERIDAGLSNETIETPSLTGETWRQVYSGRKRELAMRRADGNMPIVKGAQALPVEPEAEEEDK